MGLAESANDPVVMIQLALADIISSQNQQYRMLEDILKKLDERFPSLDAGPIKAVNDSYRVREIPPLGPNENKIETLKKLYDEHIITHTQFINFLNQEMGRRDG